jgi:flagellar biosynthesis protein FliQ
MVQERLFVAMVVCLSALTVGLIVAVLFGH